MATTLVTPESDPTNWQRLKTVWEQEHRPGYVVTNNQTYSVIQRATDGVYVFQLLDNQSMYDSVGF